MKKVWKIVRRVLLTLGLVIYIILALLNYSVVQSYLGALAGSYFSKEWGGKVYIGSHHAMPFDHVIADNLLWVSPTGDTLLKAEQLKVNFDRFPYSDRTLEFDRVYLKNAYYHFATKDHKTNLQFLIDYYRSDKKKKKKGPFTVKVKTLELDNVHYRMDLPDRRKRVYAYGVQIPHMEFFDIHAKIKDIVVVNDDVSCKILQFSTRETSGFKLDDMSGKIHVTRNEIVAKNRHKIELQRLERNERLREDRPARSGVETRNASGDERCGILGPDAMGHRCLRGSAGNIFGDH